jgi:hypothetical protein
VFSVSLWRERTPAKKLPICVLCVSMVRQCRGAGRHDQFDVFADRFRTGSAG